MGLGINNHSIAGFTKNKALYPSLKRLPAFWVTSLFLNKFQEPCFFFHLKYVEIIVTDVNKKRNLKKSIQYFSTSHYYYFCKRFFRDLNFLTKKKEKF